ncbi:MAG: type II secretion system protein GspN [Syntrophaceae bacterium]
MKKGQGEFHIKKLSLSFIILFFCIWFVWLIIPEALISDYLIESLEKRNVKVKLIDVKKGFFYTLNIEQCHISHLRAYTSTPLENHEDVPAFVIHNISITPDINTFLKLSPHLNFSGQMNDGTIRGNFAGRQERTSFQIHGENIQINGLPIIEKMGVHGDGTLMFNFQWSNQKGEMNFSLNNAVLKGSLTGFSALPLNSFKNAKGLLSVSDTITINSLTLEGTGIYVRMKGIVKESDFDGNIEIMLDSSFEHYHVIQPLLEQYKISPGFYVIPHNKKN